MASNIDKLIEKYRMSRAEADSFVRSLPEIATSGDERGKMGISQVEQLLPLALQIKRTKTYVSRSDNTVKPVTWGMAFHLASRGSDINVLIGKKRNLPGDRMDTQFIEKKFTGGIREIGATEKKFSPVYKTLKSTQGNEVRKYREEAPKYYYFNEEDKFNFEGYDSPPSNSFTPYLMVKLLHKVAASKYSKPTVTNVAGVEVVDWNKESGIKEYGVLYMVGNEIVKSLVFNLPYERDVEFNIHKGRLFKNRLRNELESFVKEHNYLLKEFTKTHPKPKLTKEEERQIESDDMYKKYYGNLLEERKRKRNKIRSKRKIIKKPQIKKKCTCNPRQKRIMKKITPRNRRK